MCGRLHLRLTSADLCQLLLPVCVTLNLLLLAAFFAATCCHLLPDDAGAARAETADIESLWRDNEVSNL